MSEKQLQYGYEDDGPDCLIGSHGVLFARVTHSPLHNALEYARLFAAAPDLLAALKYARRFLRAEDHDTAYVDGVIQRAEGA